MKRRSLIGAGLMGCFLCGLAWAGLEGSKHDFDREQWQGLDRCGVCHVPESELPSEPPLWDSRADLTRRFGREAVSESEPGFGTLTCLRCHDGTIATDTVGSATAGRFINKQNPGMFTTGHNRSDHPVGVEYPRFDREYQPLTRVVAGGNVLLPDGRVECISCHDPHNDTPHDYMLVMSNARSGLCLTCHKK